MRSAARTAVGVVLFMAAGFGLAWLFMKKNSVNAGERPTPQASVTQAEAPAEVEETKPHRHRTKHPRRDALGVETAAGARPH